MYNAHEKIPGTGAREIKKSEMRRERKLKRCQDIINFPTSNIRKRKMTQQRVRSLP